MLQFHVCGEVGAGSDGESFRIQLLRCTLLRHTGHCIDRLQALLLLGNCQALGLCVTMTVSWFHVMVHL